jgi:hypothetical protein
MSVIQAGAEICSLKSLVNGKEYIWGANPKVWASHAPILFPKFGVSLDHPVHFSILGRTSVLFTLVNFP